MAAKSSPRSRYVFLAALVVLLVGVIAAFAAASGLSLPGSDFVRVTRVEPVGNADNPTSITVAFSSPMVAADRINKPESLKNAPFTVTPAISAMGRWHSPSIYVVELSTPLAKASEYAIEMKPDVTDLKGRPLKNGYVFRTQGLCPLFVRTIYEKERALITIDFNMPVEPAVLKKFLTLKNDKKENIPFSVLETAAAPTIRLECALTKEDGYSLSIAPGLTGVEGPIPTTEKFTSTVSGVKASEAAKHEPLRVETVYSDRDSTGLRIIVRFSETADGTPPATDLRDYLTVSPEVKNLSIAPRYGAWYDAVEIKGDFKPLEKITVTLKKGFSINGENTLEKDVSRTVLMPNYQAKLKFSEEGKYLTPVRGTTVGIEAVNVKEVRYSLLRLYENNITVSMVSDNYTQFGVPEHLSQLVSSGEVKLTAALNEKTRGAFDIASLSGTKRGVFLLTLNGVPTPEGGNREWELWNIRNTIILTDIGISASKRDNGVTVWANSIARGEPLSGARVSVYSASNQLVAQGKTDADGLFTLNRSEPWETGLAPYLVTVATDDDLSFLQLRADLSARAGYDTAGRPYIESGYEAFLFTPRGVFRPGDTVDVKALVRDAKLKAPKDVPLQWRVMTPTGREMRRGGVTLGKNGAALFNLDLPASAATGLYKASLFIPGNEDTPLGTTTFSVEEFVPPRVEVRINAKLEGKARVLLPKGKINYEIEANHLFGAPAANMKYEGDFTAAPKTFTHPQWADYVFEDASRSFAPMRERVAVSGELDDKGKAETDYTAGDWVPPSMISLAFTARVQEDGGRWANQTHVANWFPAENMIGIRKTDEAHVAGKPITVNVAAITPDGKPGTLKKAKVEFFRVDTHYTWIEADGRSHYDSEEEFVPINAKGATVSLKNGTGSFTVTPPRWGEYMVRVSDENSKAAASVRLYAYSMDRAGSGRGSGLMDRVTLELDKKNYKAGDTAKLTLRAPFKGKVLLTAQTYKQLWAKVFDLTETEKTIPVPVTPDMGPNAYLTVWLLRPVTENETGGEAWSAHRAIGVTSLALDPAPLGLKVSLEAPERAVPGKTVDISVDLKDPDGNPVSGEVALALVDEGILSLTGHKTPDPLGFFTGKRMLSAGLYDMYDYLLPPELRAVPLLHPGGDADGAGVEAFMSNIRRNQEMLTVFLGKVETDARGHAATTITLPEYSGKGRIMAVAVTEAFMGSAERSVTISRDIVVEATTPRALAPGDVFTLPLAVFTTNPEKTGNAVITVTAEGPIEFSGPTSFTVALGSAPNAARQKLSLTGRALDANAAAKIIVTTLIPEDPDNSYEQRLEVPVRSPFPRVSRTGSGTVPPGGNVSVNIPSGWIKGTERAFISVSNGPKADLLTVLNQLAQYPYGCLEQTVSKAWPYVALPDLVEETDESLANPEAVKQALDAAVARVGTMQNPDGSFRMWPDQGWSTYRWGSVYATHFLLEAQKRVPVPEDMLSSALSWLQLMLARPEENGYCHTTRAEDSARAYAVFVLTLAGRAPVGWMQHLSEKQNDMYPSGRIFLAAARALHSGGAAPLRKLPKAMPVVENDSPTLDTNLRNNALLLLAWSLVEPGSAEARDLARELIGSMQKDYEYHSTQENGYASLALGRYMDATKASRKPFNAVITTGQGQLLAKGGDKTPLTVRDARLSELSPLNITSEGPGSPMFSWVASGVPVAAPTETSNNLALTRKLTAPDGTELVPGKDGALRVAQGDLINVTLTVNPGTAPLRETIIVDVLPGGLEVENPRLNNIPDNASDDDSDENDDSKPSLRIDIRDDRIILFYDLVTRPTEHTYTLRAVTKGVFTLPPAAAEGMYAPMRHARTGHGTIVVE